MTSSLLKNFTSRPGVRIANLKQNGTAVASVDELPLPSLHKQWLDQVGSISLYDGYFTLLGRSESINNNFGLRTWNQLDTWKFAWPESVNGFHCFGFTAWGDQYAYAKHELLVNPSNAPVYFLNALDMTSRKIADTFEDFVQKTLTRNSDQPSDSKIVEARLVHGPLRTGLMLSYVPSVLITGEEDVGTAIQMSQRDVMILNGDLWTQLREWSGDISELELMPWSDQQGRLRMSVVMRSG